MKTLFFHVGPFKTGSTYIQRRLASSNEALANNNLNYPRLFYSPRANNHNLFSRLIKKRNDISKYKIELGVLEKLDKDIIISSETFFQLKKYHLTEIKNIFANFNVKIIYFHRSPSLRMVSAWQESIKHGKCTTFEEYRNDNFSNPRNSSTLNHLPRLRVFEEIFGKPNLVIIDQKICKDQNSTMFTFSQALGRNDLIDDSNERVNTALPMYSVEVIRALNQIHLTVKNKSNRRVRDRFFEKHLELSDEFMLLKQILEMNERQIRLGNTQIDKYVFDQLETEFSECLFNGISRPQETEIKYYSSSWTDSKQAREVLETLYRKLEFKKK